MSAAELPTSDLSAREVYRLMTDIVAPRPIAWVSTVSADGRANLAPFSYYQAVCSSPATIVLGMGWLSDGRPKDSLANVLETGELTINHVSEPLAEAMNATSAGFAPEVSEWDACGVESSPARQVRARRVAGALAGFECRMTHAIPLGQTATGGPSSTLIIAEVVHLWLAEGLVERDGRGQILAIDSAKLAAVGRLGGIAYTTTAGRFDLERPVAPK